MYEALERIPRIVRRHAEHQVIFNNRKYRLFLGANNDLIFEVALGNGRYAWQSPVYWQRSSSRELDA